MRQAKPVLLTLSVAVLCLCALPNAADASADTLSIAAAPTSAAAGQTIRVTASGQASLALGPVFLSAFPDVFVSPASVGCAPDYDSEYNNHVANGEAMLLGFPNQGGTVGANSYSFATSITGDLDTQFAPGTNNIFMGPAGQYLLCGYLYGGGTTRATGSVQLTLRTPRDSITMAPVFHAVTRQKSDIPIHYYVEPGTTATIFVRFYPKFSVNGTSYSCSKPQNVLEGNPGPGPGSVRFPVTVPTAGTYGMCATVYVGFAQVVVATASATVIATNGASAGPKCVVPNVVGKHLAAARTMLVRAHCKPGSVSYRERRTHTRGSVVSQSAKAGRRLPAGARINLVVAK